MCVPECCMLSCKAGCQGACPLRVCRCLMQGVGSLRGLDIFVRFRHDVLPQVLTVEGALMTQPEYVLRFKPPLTITNLLPFDMTVIITDRSAESPVVKHHAVVRCTM